MADINVLHVSAPGCHLQEVFQIKGVQSECANQDVALPSFEWLKYYQLLYFFHVLFFIWLIQVLYTQQMDDR